MTPAFASNYFPTTETDDRWNPKSHSDADVQASIAYGKRMNVYPLAVVAAARTACGLDSRVARAIRCVFGETPRLLAEAGRDRRLMDTAVQRVDATTGQGGR